MAVERIGQPPREREGDRVPQSPLPLLEAIIGLKRSQCSDEGVTFRCEGLDAAVAIARAGVEEYELCAVVQNLLENAYEESVLLDLKYDPFVDIAFSCTAGNATVAVRNRTVADTPPSSRRENQMPSSTASALAPLKTSRKDTTAALITTSMQPRAC